jgi:hypothetical protein
MVDQFVTGQSPTSAKMNEVTEMLAGGTLRGLTDAAATSGTTELAIATTGVVSLRASTTYQIRAKYYWTNTVANDVFFFRIRQTNTSGTILNGIVGQPGLGGGPYATEVTYTFETSVANTAVYLADIVRGSGTGTATVRIPSHIQVVRIGPSGVFTIV